MRGERKGRDEKKKIRCGKGKIRGERTWEKERRTASTRKQWRMREERERERMRGRRWWRGPGRARSELREIAAPSEEINDASPSQSAPPADRPTNTGR